MSETFRTPAITATALRHLGGPISEALRALNCLAAMDHVRDIMIELNHETAWCYETDKDLPHIAAYFVALHSTCAQIASTPPTDQRPLVQEVLRAIQILLDQMTYALANCVAEAPPDIHVGIDEIEHRQRRYGDLAKATPATKVFD